MGKGIGLRPVEGSQSLYWTLTEEMYAISEMKDKLWDRFEVYPSLEASLLKW